MISENIDNTDVDELVKNYENNRLLNEEITKCLNKKHSLEQFSEIQITLTNDYPVSNDIIFKHLIRTKVLAQSLLNRYYYNTNYENCSLSSAIVEDCKHAFQKQIILPNQIPNFNVLIRIILQYLVLAQILSKREVFKKTVKVMEQCEYCDNSLGDDDIQCSVCLADVYPQTLQKLFCQDNYNHESTNVKQMSQNSNESSSSCWECLVCTYHNKLMNDRCEICQNEMNENDSKAKERGGPNDDHLYETSNEENIVARNELEISNEKLNHMEDLFDMWACVVCTFNNKSENQCCEACLTNRNTEINNNDMNRDLNSVARFNYEVSVEVYDWVIIDLEKCYILREGFKYGDTSSLSSFGETESLANSFQSADNDWIDIKMKRCVHLQHESRRYNSDTPGDLYYCNNHWCIMINKNGVIHSCRCILSDGSDATEYNLVTVHDGNSLQNMWECTFCREFNLNNNCAPEKNICTLL